MRLSPKHWLRLYRNPWLKTFYAGFRQWKRDGMQDRSKRFDGLAEGDFALDFGGFRGDWAAEIFRTYGCRVAVFEPHPRFAAALRDRFHGIPQITVHEVALGKGDGTLNLSDEGDASSALKATKTSVVGTQRDAATFLASLSDGFALAKINIEGGEYDLLPALIDSGIIGHIRQVQVQFHLFAETDIARRAAIRAALSRTHTCVWNYDFVWERWIRNAD